MANVAFSEKKLATVETGTLSKVSGLRKLVDVVFYEITKDAETELSFSQFNIDSDKSFPMYQPKVDHDYNEDSCNRKELHNDAGYGLADQQLDGLAKMKTPNTHQVYSIDVGLSKSNFHRTILTPEIQADLEILRNRHTLDPKRHYKRTHRNLPKLFQMARIVNTPKGIFSSRSRKNERVFVDDLLVDNRFRKHCTKKFMEIQQSRRHKNKFAACR